MGWSPRLGRGEKQPFGASFSRSSSFFAPVSRRSEQVGAENEADSDQFAGSGKVFFPLPLFLKRRNGKKKKKKNGEGVGELNKRGRKADPRGLIGDRQRSHCSKSIKKGGRQGCGAGTLGKVAAEPAARRGWGTGELLYKVLSFRVCGQLSGAGGRRYWRRPSLLRGDSLPHPPSEGLGSSGARGLNPWLERNWGSWRAVKTSALERAWGGGRGDKAAGGAAGEAKLLRRPFPQAPKGDLRSAPKPSVMKTWWTRDALLLSHYFFGHRAAIRMRNGQS